MNARLRQLLDSLSVPDAEACWRPPLDVYQTRGGWLIKVDLAGVRPADIQVQFQGRQVIVSGIRRDLAVTQGHQAYSMEISYSSFRRAVDLPCELEHSVVQSDYRDGMLLISIAPQDR